MAKLLPAILESDLRTIQEKVNWLLERRQLFWRVQLDVMDGTFTQVTSFHDARALPDLGLDCEAHLMVNHPDLILRGWLKHPNVKRIIVHVESLVNLENLITQVHVAHKEISLACSPDTPSRIFDPYMSHIDGVLLLAVHPGKQAQPMNLDVLEKVKEIKAKAPDLSICIDGGVNTDTLERVLQTGLDEVVMGSAIWKAADQAQALQALAVRLSQTA